MLTDIVCFLVRLTLTDKKRMVLPKETVSDRRNMGKCKSIPGATETFTYYECNVISDLKFWKFMFSRKTRHNAYEYFYDCVRFHKLVTTEA